MSIWLRVYCSRPVNDVSAADILNGINDTDFFTVAEGFGIEDEDEVNRALDQLVIEPTGDPDGAKFRLIYQSSELPPVFIHVTTDVEHVQVEREEVLEDLQDVQSSELPRVLSHLNQVVEIVAVQLRTHHLQDMGLVLAGQVAEYFAEHGAGLIKDQNRDWWAVEDRVPTLLIGPPSRG